MNILFIGYEFWDSPVRRHHHFSIGMSEKGYKCVFLDPPVSILDKKFQKQRKKGVRWVSNNLIVYSPIAFVPLGRFKIVSSINGFVYRKNIFSLLKKKGPGMSSVILFIWDFWEADKYVGKLKEQLVVFDIYDNYLAYEKDSNYRKLALKKIEWLVNKSDIIIASSTKQFEFACDLRGSDKDVWLIENGVNVENYLNCQHAENLFNNDNPVIVYLGGNNFETCPKLDWQLIDFITNDFSLNFLFIGPVDEINRKNEWLSKIRRKKNVIFTGKVEANDLPRLMKGASVGIIPWKLTEFTTWVYPLKINEYFAAGLPVVSTPLPDVVDLRNRLGSIVSIAQTEEDSLSSLREMIRKHDALSSKCIEVAKNNSWSKKVERILYIIKTKLIYSN